MRRKISRHLAFAGAGLSTSQKAAVASAGLAVAGAAVSGNMLNAFAPPSDAPFGTTQTVDGLKSELIPQYANNDTHIRAAAAAILDRTQPNASSVAVPFGNVILPAGDWRRPSKWPRSCRGPAT